MDFFKFIKENKCFSNFQKEIRELEFILSFYYIKFINSSHFIMVIVKFKNKYFLYFLKYLMVFTLIILFIKKLEYMDKYVIVHIIFMMLNL